MKEEKKFEAMVRPRIAYTVDEETKRELDKVIQKEKQLAQARDMPSPSDSQIADMVIRKGTKTYWNENK